MKRGRLGGLVAVAMVAVLALGFGAAQAAPIPEVTFDPASSAAGCFNCPAGGPFSAAPAPLLGLSYSGSTWGGETSGGFLAIGGAGNNFGSLTLAAGANSYFGNTFRLEVTFVLDPPGLVVPESSPEFTALLIGQTSASGAGGASIIFTGAPQMFTYTAGAESGKFSLFVNPVSVFPGQTVPVTGQIIGASSMGPVPEPGVTLLLGSVLAALAFVGHRAARSR